MTNKFNLVTLKFTLSQIEAKKTKFVIVYVCGKAILSALSVPTPSAIRLWRSLVLTLDKYSSYTNLLAYKSFQQPYIEYKTYLVNII